jgi:hypothetical protein
VFVVRFQDGKFSNTVAHLRKQDGGCGMRECLKSARHAICQAFNWWRLRKAGWIDLGSGHIEFVLGRVALWHGISKYEIIGDHQCEFQHNKSSTSHL